jgi:hypothetical protein
VNECGFIYLYSAVQISAREDETLVVFYPVKEVYSFLT